MAKTFTAIASAYIAADRTIFSLYDFLTLTKSDIYFGLYNPYTIQSLTL